MSDDGQNPQTVHSASTTSSESAPSTPAGVRDSEQCPSTEPAVRRSWYSTAAGLAAILILAAIVWALVTDPDTPQASTAPATPAAAEQDIQIAVPQQVPPSEVAKLPVANTFGTVPAVHANVLTPGISLAGRVLHPADTTVGYASPGGPPTTAIPSTQINSPTWLPIVDERPGWARVELPARPDGATAWVYLHNPGISIAYSPFKIIVDRAHYRITLNLDGRELGHWTVGVGKKVSPTPAGWTFVMASIRDTHPTFSPIVLPLGTHSNTYTSYGGGPGTVGIHTWPSSSVYGHSSSDGCVRVPPDALALISSRVPLGTPVDIL